MYLALPSILKTLGNHAHFGNTYTKNNGKLVFVGFF